MVGVACRGWQLCRGLGGNLPVGWVAGFGGIGWQPSRGLGGRNPWNTHWVKANRPNKSPRCSGCMCPQFTVLLARTLPEWYGEHSLNRFSVPMLPNTLFHHPFPGSSPAFPCQPQTVKGWVGTLPSAFIHLSLVSAVRNAFSGNPRRRTSSTCSESLGDFSK